jgi:hypothetical protein
MQMSDRQLAECKRITNILFDSPGCALFREPVDPARVPEYYKVIKYPRDLGTIRTRLNQNQYATVSFWERDVELVWSNAERFNGANTLIGGLAKAMEAKYKKLKQNLKLTSPMDWIARISAVYDQLNQRLLSAPGELKVHFKGKNLDGPVPEADVEHFCNAVTALTERSDILQMIQLLTLHGVKLDVRKEETVVMVKDLPAEALNSLIAYTKERYRSLKLPYPT